uniref:CW-type domain-containing protein n=1 Tax=Gouania willdenowi TaxID=441366 RepID=A0A8C5GGN0_GOUWI
MAAQTDRGVPLSTLSPRFLYSNSTSHIWPFSAIAELIDNAYDPDVCAKQFWIDKTVVKGEECLSFMDNGNGLDNETMHKMLSFGYSDKTAVGGVEPIGIYGNGFKSGSMRLGKDAIVFSKSKDSLCVGMLSQTYLEQINAKQIIVPIVCFEMKQKNPYILLLKKHKASLQDILHYSPFNTQQELLTEINAITSTCSTSKTGTRIIIWNLRRTSSGKTEFDFGKDRYDIRIPSEVYESYKDPSLNTDRFTSYIPESFYSLRAYCSILYLKPRMQVMVRGQMVKSQLIAKSLAHIRRDHYKPNFLDGKRIQITFGYNTKSKDQYGIMMYHKNRLIKAYERVGCQLRANKIGVGVIGVIECNFLEPTHNKQSFLESEKYRKTMVNLATKLEEYWKEMCYRKSKDNPNSTIPLEDTMKKPDQNWVQCGDCLQWRKLPDGIDCKKLPNQWFCRMNPDPQFSGKRLYPITAQETPKKPRLNGFSVSDPGAAASSSPSSSSMSAVTDYQNTDNDIVILESASTPKPRLTVSAVGKVKIKKEQSDDDISMLLECFDDAAVDDQMEAEADAPAQVKQVEKGTQSMSAEDQAEIKQEADANGQNEKQNLQVMQNGVSNVLEAKPEMGSSPDNKCPLPYLPNEIEAQEQQDQLLVLMQSTALERDCLQVKVHQLTCQLQDIQTEVSSLRIKKESTDQACQTENTDEKDFKSLFENARQKEVETSMSLSNLRRNIGRLLITYVPVLDLEQVNYECSVIDEILAQGLVSIGWTPFSSISSAP